jgi:hypothetical protein
LFLQAKKRGFLQKNGKEKDYHFLKLLQTLLAMSDQKLFVPEIIKPKEKELEDVHRKEGLADDSEIDAIIPDSINSKPKDAMENAILKKEIFHLKTENSALKKIVQRLMRH